MQSESASAEPAPPAPTCSARLPFGSKPERLSASVKPPPSVMSPCQRPSASRRITLQTSSTRARSVVVSQWRNATGLCGTVITMPSRFGSFLARRKNSSTSAGFTCSGIMIASLPRAAKPCVMPAGDFTCAIGSPMVTWMRVAPLRAGSMSVS